LPSRAPERAGVGEELSVDGVGDAPLEGTHGFFLGLAFGDLAVEERAAWGVGVADLGDGGDVESCLLPRRDSRWMIRPPEDISMGAVPV
jgi:hypothetical protein